MAKKYFWKYVMDSEDSLTKLVSGKFVDEEGEEQSIHDGALVVIGDLCDHSVYSNIKDLDLHKITTPAADTDKVAIVDIVTVANGDIAGQNYREGINTVGLEAPAGLPVRVRRLSVGDKFFLASGNFASDPTIGEYAIPTADSTLFTPATSVAAGKTTIKILDSMPLVEGTVDTDTKYFCMVEQIA